MNWLTSTSSKNEALAGDGLIMDAESLLAEIDYTFVSENSALNNKLGKYVGLLSCINFELDDADLQERLSTYHAMIESIQDSIDDSPTWNPEVEAFVEKLSEYQPRLETMIVRVDEMDDGEVA